MSEKKKASREDLMTECSCGVMSYVGGWCFGYGRSRPSKPARHADERDLAERGRMVLRHGLSEFGWLPNQWNE